MTRRPAVNFSRLLDLAENHSALAAVRLLADATAQDKRPPHNPLFLHGPAGTGKTSLVTALQMEVIRRRASAVIACLNARELEMLVDGREATSGNWQGLDESDLVVVDDIHQLAPRYGESLAQAIDALQTRQVPMVFTATVGPRFLPFSSRLVSRLASGLVVGVELLQAPSRLKFLQAKAQEKQLAVRLEVLTWLAEHMHGSGRELEGLVIRLEALARVHRGPLDVTAVAHHFKQEVEASKPTLDRIIQKVTDYFRVPVTQLLSDRRDRRILLPRQISMYLSRQLTGLSFAEIGGRFGGRDHSTVLHACRKIFQAVARDKLFAGTVRELQAALS
jgi:chromosomal replication initiator protein